MTCTPSSLRIAVLVKQVPKADALRLGADGRLVRDGLELEMNPYCRRAVGKGVELARASGGTCTVLTLGPPAAAEVLREAVAWGADDAVLVTDPAFAGSDTLATARALSAALCLEGPFDLILFGRNSVDADTGQVPPQVAEMLGLPFVTGVRQLTVAGRHVELRGEHDDGYVEAAVDLPVVLSVAERLCEPAKVDPAGRAAVAADRVRRRGAGDLGSGPWGQAGSPTRVGAVRVEETARPGRRLNGALDDQLDEAMELLLARGALAVEGFVVPVEDAVPDGRRPTGDAGSSPVVAVLVEPDRPSLTDALLGAAAGLATGLRGSVTAIGAAGDDPAGLGPLGADLVVALTGSDVEEDVAHAMAAWMGAGRRPTIVLAPGTAWGREVASRLAVRLGAGLIGDAVALELHDGRLTAWKPAFGGALVAAITSDTDTQIATVRPGVLPRLRPRAGRADVVELPVEGESALRVSRRERDDDVEALARAEAIVGVGSAVPPERYGELDGLLGLLGAELAATRKVTDRGWLPRARQIGITGRTVEPRLYVALGVAGKFNHVVGVRRAGTVLAVNRDPDAPIFSACDIGIVGDWAEVVAGLTRRLRQAGIASAGRNGWTSITSAAG